MKKTFSSWRKLINNSLKKYLDLKLHTFSGDLERAMKYAVFPGGKRIRPLLALASAYACGTSVKKAIPVACAIELIHSYSLIHDDLPSMDDDDFRRGKPSLHKKFGEGIAILAGDALLTLAFSVIANHPGSKNKQVNNFLLALKILGEAAGPCGMIAGQAADTFFKQAEKVSKKNLINYIHAKKTGALIEASVLCGAAVAKCGKKGFDALRMFGRNVGFAFQIIDDIFDRDKRRLIYPVIYGFEEAKKKADALVSKAISAIEIFNERAMPLKALAEYAIKRRK
ncbi:MAG: polyprenyl synthetase family protein [Elusimicrobiota bacterium]